MPTLSFIGSGNMAEAIARGVLRSALYAPRDLRACDPNLDRRRLFEEELRIAAFGDCGSAAEDADIVVLAVKPFVIGEALAALRGVLKPGALVVSIAAGISCQYIESALGGGEGAVRVIRAMPNTPMLAGKGMTALAKGGHATDADLIAAERIFNAAGQTARVSEALMDAVTAVSGSGPAYVFYLAEALAQAGAAAGLPADEAARLARQTVIGAAALLELAKDSPGDLRRKVTTPNGTTQAAIVALEAGNFAALIGSAVQAAARRSAELGK